ncbi:YopX family protein [Dorea longicatena]|nr:YopX family protein [Dorea longicatena]
MNREILFRGKHIHAMDSNEHLNGTWVHGYLSDKDYIYDKSLEGDIVRYGEVCGEVKFGLHESNWQIGKYNQGFFVTFPKEYLLRNELGYWRNKIVVVGNVFDNPELLEEVE